MHVVSHQTKLITHSLGNKHSIEWIFVMKREVSQNYRVMSCEIKKHKT